MQYLVREQNTRRQCCGSKYIEFYPDPRFYHNLDLDPVPDPGSRQRRAQVFFFFFLGGGGVF